VREGERARSVRLRGVRAALLPNGLSNACVDVRFGLAANAPAETLDPMSAQTPGSPYLPFRTEVRAPRKRLPAGSCDCHFHVFEDAVRYPMGEPRSYTPTPAPLSAYRRMADALGLERAVLVHPSVYGRDHSSFEDTLAACGDWMRGVAVVYPDTTDAQIERWHALGARGARCNALYAGGAGLEDLPGIAARVAPLGWHLQLLIDVSADPDAVARIADCGVPVVVDHFGHVKASEALASPGFQNLLALVREGRAWVKISGAYRVSSQRSGFDELAPLVDALCKADSKQLVWGTDWPHPAISAPMPDDGDLADALFDWLGEKELQQILVDNPTRLYWT
jgi:2-pyrone-4,6-dicarboxylate lactonase